MTNKRQLNGEDAGLIHLPGLDAHDHSTFCGHCWNSDGGWSNIPIKYENVSLPATCPGCLRAAAEAQALLTRAKRRKLWVVK